MASMTPAAIYYVPHYVTRAPADDAALGAWWVAAAKAAATILPFLSAGKPKPYTEMKAAANQIAATYGTNLAAAAQAMGVDPNALVQALSGYAKQNGGFNLPVAVIVADQEKKFPASAAANTFNSNMTPIILAGGAAVLIVLLMRRK